MIERMDGYGCSACGGPVEFQGSRIRCEDERCRLGKLGFVEVGLVRTIDAKCPECRVNERIREDSICVGCRRMKNATEWLEKAIRDFRLRGTRTGRAPCPNCDHKSAKLEVTGTREKPTVKAACPACEWWART